jgi:hypothetical protein
LEQTPRDISLHSNPAAGTHLLLRDIPLLLRRRRRVDGKEEVTFTQITAETDTQRDAVRVADGREIRLQKLSVGQRVKSVGDPLRGLPSSHRRQDTPRRDVCRPMVTSLGGVPGRRPPPLHSQRDARREPPVCPDACMECGEDENRSLRTEGTRRGDLRSADVMGAL